MDTIITPKVPIGYIQCNKCNMQYISISQLSDRFTEHRCSIEKFRNPHHFYHPIAVSDHFSLPDHSFKNIELIPLELINSDRDMTLSVRPAKDF